MTNRKKIIERELKDIDMYNDLLFGFAQIALYDDDFMKQIEAHANMRIAMQHRNDARLRLSILRESS